MVTIDVLDPPVIKTTPFGDVTLTHRAWGFTIQAWANPPMRSYTVLGILENEAFTVYPGTDEYATFTMADFLALSSDAITGPHVTATVEAIKAAHLLKTTPTVPLQMPAPTMTEPQTSKGVRHATEIPRRTRRPVRDTTRRKR